MEESKRQRIFGSAARVFGKLGYKKASVDLIAQEAGVAKGTVYLAATSKEELFLMAIASDLRAWLHECEMAIDPDVSADVTLATLLGVARDYVKNRPLVRQLLFGEAQLIIPAYADRCSDLAREAKALVVRVLDRGVRDGTFKKGLDTPRTAALLTELMIARLLFDERMGVSDAEAFANAALGLELVLDGLRSR